MREGIDSAKEFADEFKDRMRETLAEIAGLVIGVESIKEALDRTFEGVKGIFELSKDLEHLSDRTGIATKDLVQLQTEFKLSGLQAEEVGQTINRMQRSIENAADKGGEAATIFARLGINIYELRGLNPAAQFDLIRQSIAGIEDPARRAQVAMQLFGKQGAEMLSLFRDKGIGEEAANALGAQADILAQNADTFQQIAGLMEVSGIKIQGFFVGLAEPLGRVILPVLKAFESFDFVAWGQRIGNSLADAVRVFYNAFEDGKLSELTRLSLTVGFEKAVNTLAGGLYAAFHGIGDIILGVFSPGLILGWGELLLGQAEEFGGKIAESIAILANTDFWKGIAEVALGGFTVFQEGLIEIAFNFGEVLGSVLMNSAFSLGREIAGIFSKIPGLLEQAGELYEYAKDGEKNPVNAAVAAAQASGNISALSGILGFDFTGKSTLDQGQADLKKSLGEKNLFSEMAGGEAEMGKGETALGKSDIAGAVNSTFQQFLSDIKASAPINVLGDDSKKLSDLISSLNKAIKGEGTANSVEAPPSGGGQNPGLAFGAGKEITGIHMGGGGWQGVHAFEQGPVSIEGGMSRRAGRLMEPQHTVEQNTAQTNMILGSIHNTLTDITAPS